MTNRILALTLLTIRDPSDCSPTSTWNSPPAIAMETALTYRQAAARYFFRFLPI
jgi:hypothetical protein